MKKVFWSAYFFIFNYFTLTSIASAASLQILAPMRMLNPSLIKQFEQENNCEVKVDFIVDSKGYESQLRSDLKVFDVVIADERSLVHLTTANLLKVLPESIQQPRSFATPLQLKTTFNTEVNTYVPLFVNPLGIAYKPSVSHIPVSGTWNLILDNEQNPFWRQHVYVPKSFNFQVSLALLAANVPLTNPRQLPEPTREWLKSLKSQNALLSKPLSFTLRSSEVNAAILFYSEYLHYKEYIDDLDFLIPMDGTYFDRYGIAWCLSSTQDELSQRFISFMSKNSYKFSEFNHLFDVNFDLNTQNSAMKRFYTNTTSYKKNINTTNWKLYDESITLPLIRRYKN